MVGVLLVAWYLMTMSASSMGKEYSHRYLQNAQTALNHYFQSDRDRWNTAGKLILEDRRLLAAIRNKDTELTKRLLAPYRQELQVSHLTVASGSTAARNATLPFVKLRTGLYHQLMVPIEEAGPQHWLRIVNELDQKTVNSLANLTESKVTLLVGNENGFEVFGSTLAKLDDGSIGPSQQAELRNALAERDMMSDQAVEIARAIPLGKPSASIFVVVQAEVNSIAEATLVKLGTYLMVLLVLGVIFAVHGGYQISKMVSRNLKMLADHAKQIQLGNYAKTIEINSDDEVGELAYTLNIMTQSVALREEEMMHMAYSDPLTNLPNRAMFNERLTHAVSTTNRVPTPFSVLMIDLDRFKFINDVLGHEAGDMALRIVAKRLQETLRQTDTVARLGGDEFGILLPTADHRRIIDTAQKLIHTLQQPIPMESQHVDLGGSIGIACYPSHATEASELLRFADVAMYEAKSSGSGYAFFDANSDAFQQTHLSLLGDIRKAVTNNEFELFFQPKVALSVADIPSMEVLIRWNHPERGFIAPDDFIPFAESTGSIRLITHWVIDTAIAQAGRWHEEGTEVKISLNVSSRDLLNPHLAEIVANALGKSMLPVEHLCLEITESALLDDPDKARNMVQELHDMGIHLSIDDYGTGYSSLAYVANLPVDELKIDKVFVNNMLGSAEDAAIVRSTIELGHYLKMLVIAEGIEEQDELEKLREFGCDYAQGYLISKPMNEINMLTWLASGDWRKYGSPANDSDAGIDLMNKKAANS